MLDGRPPRSPCVRRTGGNILIISHAEELVGKKSSKMKQEAITFGDACRVKATRTGTTETLLLFSIMEQGAF
jgi:hypothetical protein